MTAILNDKGNVKVTCDQCGKPITHSNEWGMFCDNNCGLVESKTAKINIMNIIKSFKPEKK